MRNLSDQTILHEVAGNTAGKGVIYDPLRVFRTIAIFSFFVGLVAPFIFYVGPFRLSVYRVVLIIFLVPSLLSWVTGYSGRIRLVDVLICLHAPWAAAALLRAHGLEGGGEFAGIWIIETVTPFLVARWCVRDAADFRLFVNIWIGCIAVLVPFAVIETLTARPILLSLLSNIAPVTPNVPEEARWGLDRAQTAFEHPILFGTFCAGALGVLFCFPSMLQRAVRGLPIAVGTFCSLSAGAWLALYLQGLLMLWELTTRRLANRWIILGSLFVVGYVSVDIVSSRNPFLVFIDYLTFNQGASYNRVLIWTYGTASVWSHPWFGIGLGDWERPYWMGASVDNFWLLLAMRYGLPGFATFAVAVILLCWQLGRKRLDGANAACRLGLLVTIGGLSIAGATVHYWNATYCLFMFLLGSGMWMLDAPVSQSNGVKRPQTDVQAAPSRDLLPIRYRSDAPSQQGRKVP